MTTPDLFNPLRCPQCDDELTRDETGQAWCRTCGYEWDDNPTAPLPPNDDSNQPTMPAAFAAYPKVVAHYDRWLNRYQRSPIDTLNHLVAEFDAATDYRYDYVTSRDMLIVLASLPECRRGLADGLDRALRAVAREGGAL